MKPILCVLLLASGCMWADEAADRAAIDNTIATLNEGLNSPGGKISDVVLADVETDQLESLATMHQQMADRAKRPWSELSAPQIFVKRVRFLTSEVAMVNAADTQYGSMGGRSVPVLLVMKKKGSEWRIASLNVLSGCPGPSTITVLHPDDNRLSRRL